MAAKKSPGKKSESVKDDYVIEVDGVEVRLPSLSYLKPGLIRKLRHLDQVDAMYTLMETVLGEDSDAMAVIDDMDPDQFAEMLEGWRDHSGVSLGESNASTS